MIKGYVLQNWALILILAAFAISLRETIFLDKATIRRLYGLIVAIFLLSIVVYVEFYLSGLSEYSPARPILMAIRYSATPFIIACVMFTFAKGLRWIIFIPAVILAVINFTSISNGIVFTVGEDNSFSRGPLGYLPFVMVGIYCVFMFYILLQQSSRKKLEVIPIAFLGIAFASGLVLPFVYGKDYAQIFCTTIAIALYVYYEFSILTLTKRDALTGLLNRQAYYSNTENNPENITALISIDMNGLKAINDNGGHAAGDEALVTLARCFMDALHSSKQRCYRTGGDEFVVVCHQTPESETVALVERIKQNVAATPYHCAIGYSCAEEGTASADDLLKRSDDMMYADKTRYYEESGAARRQA